MGSTDSAPPRALVGGAEVLVGGKRHLAMVPDHPAEKLGWEFPLDPLMAALQERRPKRTVVLATGDPMCFGIGSTLVRHLPAEEMRFIPAPSAFDLACARMAWPRHTVETLTLHGRPLEILNGWLTPAARLLLLSHDGETPAKVASHLCAHGFGPSKLTVLEHMGGEKERRFDGLATSWSEPQVADFNTIAVECAAEPGASVHARVPGLPDEAFVNDGQLSKREVRAATLSRLMPLPGQRLWDVGAGCGSISIEWLRAAANTEAIAIERVADRAAMAADNAAALGVPHLRIVAGDAPAALTDLPRADAIFIGGGLATPGLVDACWTALPPGGRLVANTVTVESERTLFEWQGRVGGALTRLAVSRAEPLGEFLGWRALMPVTQWAVVKS